MNQDWRSIGIVAAVAAVTRGAVLAAALAGIGPLDQLSQDPDSYRQIAETLADSGTFGITAEDGSVDPTAFRPPLYPWLLSWFVSGDRLPDAAVGLLHLGMGLLTCLGVYAVTARLVASTREGRRVATAAGCLTAIDPLLLMQSTLVMTETLAAGIAVAAWWVAVRGWTSVSGRRPLTLPNRRPHASGVAAQRALREPWPAAGWGWGFALGALLAAGFLCRPVFAVWIAFWIFWLACRIGLSPRSRHWAAPQAVAIGIVVAVAIGGWMIRNRRVIGEPVWATTHGGYTLLLGNNPFFYDYLESRSFAEAAFWGAAWDAEDFHQDWARRQAQLQPQLRRSPRAPLSQDALPEDSIADSELMADRLAGELARQEIRRRPGMFVYSCLVRVGRLWSPIPRIGNGVGLASWAIGAFYGILAMGTIAGVWRLRWQIGSPGWAPPLLLLAAVTAVHAVYWSNLRMRAPVMPMVAAIAAVGFLGNRQIGPFDRNSLRG